MITKQIFYGVADNATTFQLMNRSQVELQTANGDYYPNPYPGPVCAGQWFEIERAEYWYFLECLPPLAMLGGAFAMSEFRAGNLTDAFFHIGERYFCMTIEVASLYIDDQEEAAAVALTDATRSLCAALTGNMVATPAAILEGERHVF